MMTQLVVSEYGYNLSFTKNMWGRFGCLLASVRAVYHPQFKQISF